MLLSSNKYALLFLMSCVLSAPSIAATNATARLSTQLGNLHSMEADFQGRVVSANHKTVHRMHGHMSLKRPNRFRWEPHPKGDSQLIIADGQHLWVYDASLDQVIQKSIAKFNGTNPAALLSGSAQVLSQQFVVEKNTRSKSGSEWFFLRPKRRSSSLLKSLQLHFHHKKLIAIRMVDNLDQTTYFKFSHIRVNRAIAAKTFQFSSPDGVDLIQGD